MTLMQTAGVRLLAARRTKQHQPWSPTLGRLLTRFRQIIETVNQQLTDQFTIEQTVACSFSGLCAACIRKYRPILCVSTVIGCVALPIGCR
jgi:hypothetical protein